MRKWNWSIKIFTKLKFVMFGRARRKSQETGNDDIFGACSQNETWSISVTSSR